MSLHSVGAGCVADVSEEHAALVVGVEKCRVGEFKWIYVYIHLYFKETTGRELGGLVSYPGLQGQ